MEFKTLLAGMFISMAAFSVKAGIGWAYLWSSGGRKIAATLGIIVSYAALFAAVYFVSSRLNFAADYGTLLPLLNGGVTLHWIAAALILIWGLFLLGSFRRDNAGCGARGSRAWLALVIPCPVCASAVLMSASCLALYFPGHAASGAAALCAAFILLGGASGTAAIAAGKVKAENSPERSLGTAMIMVSAYFMLSALITPQAAELSRVYRMASYAREGAGSAAYAGWAALAVLALFTAGFIWDRHSAGKPEKSSAVIKINEYGSETR